MKLSSKKDLESYCELFEQVCVETVEKIVIKKKPAKRKNNWWNNDLQKLKTDYKRAKRKKSSNISEIKQNYEEAIMNAKREAWKTFVSSCENAGDAFLRNRILNKPKSKTFLAPILDDHGEPSTSIEATTELLLNSVAKPLPVLSKQQTLLEKRVSEFMKSANPRTEPNISEEEIETAIRELKPKKSPGKDQLPNQFYKHCEKVIVPYLLKIYNASLDTGCFPANFKEGEIIFLKKPQKSGNRTNHYRPITLLTTISKIWEKILNKRLKYFTRLNNWISEDQFGYQQNVSAEDAVASLTKRIKEDMKTKLENLTVYFDVSGAFNDLWHTGLLNRLIKLKCPPEYI